MQPIYKRILKVVGVGILVIALAMVYFSFNPLEHTFFLQCPFHSLTGYYCPGCGSQRAIHQLLHGDLYLAFSYNPFMVLSLPLIAYGIGTKLYNYIFQAQHRVQLFYKNWFIYGYFAIAVLYWILRNLSFEPFRYLAPME
ncbi:MAG: DUF2752 domain-containing protein [Marinirhabdus sp.]|nr:DUF2752 domain-containing protein [Marinirhabdus sp.]